MRMFVWKQIDQATDSYHPEGGVVVIAHDEARAREIANARPGTQLAATETPDYWCEVSETEERIFVFPNAGCC